MTSNSTPDSSPLDETWLNQDSAQRINSIQNMDGKDSDVADTLLRIAQGDEHEAVRCSAVEHITELGHLEQLLRQGGKVQEYAQQQIYRVLAGNIESNLNEQERIKELGKLPSKAIKQLALITKSKTTATIVVNAIDQNDDLADLCLFAGSVHVRKSAALKIADLELLEEILKKVTGKDKTVTKVISNRLESAPSTPRDGSTTTVDSEPSVGKKPVDNKSESIAKNKGEDGPAANQDDDQPKKPEVTNIEPSTEIAGVENEVCQLSFKNTARLFELRSQLRKLHARIDKTEEQLVEKLQKLQAIVAEKITKNNEFQEQLKSQTEELLSSLIEALESGNSANASLFWDKIQGNISNTANQIRAELLKKSNIHKEKIKELRDWKLFAATEKKKELIVQMQQLGESQVHPSDRSKNISKMHKEWKKLGLSSQNEQLWKQFKKLSDLAYEPCKEYFKERKKLMAANLIKRREICDGLEANLKVFLEADDEPDISKLNKLLSESETNWKSFAPIEQSKIKALQKRYYGIANQLRKMRKSKLSASAGKKQDLINQAQELTKHEDNKHAMNEAKRLQQEWKRIGPTTYREDQKYWQDFRTACDAIFAKRKSGSNELQDALKKIENRLNAILAEMNSIGNIKSDDDFRESQASYRDLAQEFSNSLDPRIKSHRKKLLERFNSTKRQIDSRFRALPDKRQLKLRQLILEKTSALIDCENALLAESNPTSFLSLQESFDRGSWENSDACGDSEIDELLNSRFSALSSSQSPTEFAERCKSCEEQFRILCTQAEIRSNVETPAEDKALRMKIQLEQLQSDFGQAKPGPKQNLKYAMRAEFQALALGPLDDNVRKALTARLDSVVQKLRDT